MSEHIDQNLRDKEYTDKMNTLMSFFDDSVPGGYHRYSLAEGYPLTYASDKFTEMLGFTVEELRDQFDSKFINLVHPDDRNMLINATNNSVGHRFNVHYRIQTNLNPKMLPRLLRTFMKKKYLTMTKTA